MNIASVASVASLASLASAQTPLAARLQSRLDSIKAAGTFPGATIGIALPDGRTIALATGQSDTTRDTPMAPRARMMAGSAGKTFFAALAVHLAREGRLDLDAPIARWLGNEPWFDSLPNARQITVPLGLLPGLHHRGAVLAGAPHRRRVHGQHVRRAGHWTQPGSNRQ